MTEVGKRGRLVCLCWFFWLLAFTGAFGAVILYDHNDGQAYGRILAELTGDEVQGQPSSQLLRWLAEDEVLAIEAYDVQAAVLQQNRRIPYYWYPHYTATVVLAVADTCPFPITGWQSLAAAPVSLALTADEPESLFFMQAMSYGLDGNLSGQAGMDLLQRIQEQGRLQMAEGPQHLPAQVWVLFDYQARQWQRRGAPIHLVVPVEGTLSFQKGLLAKRPLALDDYKLSEMLISQDYTLIPPSPSQYISENEMLFQEADKISRQIDYRLFKRYQPTVLTGTNYLTWYMAVLFLTILWGCRLRRQVLQPPVRQAYLGVIITLCAWILLRCFKLSFPVFWADGIRWSWYSYYLFYGILISLLVWIGYVASHIGLTRSCPGWLKGLFVGNLLLAIGILTNDFHQWAFTFSADVIVADSDHGYGPLYFLLAFSYGAEFLAVNGALCYTSLHQRVGPSWRLVLPLACTLVYGGYVIGYAWGLPNVFRSELILTTVICTLVWLEIVTKGRFLPANEGYVEFFRQSNLAMQLYDDTGRVCYASHDVERKVQTDWEAQSMPIRGGWVRWYRDIRPLREKQAALRRVNRALTRSYELRCRAGAIRRQVVDRQVRQRIYRELEEIIAQKRPAIEERLTYLKTARPGPDTDAVVCWLHILACYLKKRCVLLLRGREDGTLDARELFLALQESQRYLDQAGLQGRVGFDLSGRLPASAALTLYDVFEEVGEAALAQHESYWLCQFREAENHWIFSLVLEKGEGPDWLPAWQGLAAYDVAVRCDDTGYGQRLTVCVGKEGDHG